MICTERIVPSQITICGLTGGAERWLIIRFDLSRPPVTFIQQVLEVLPERAPLSRNGDRGVMFFDRALSFIVNYSPDEAVCCDLDVGDRLRSSPGQAHKRINNATDNGANMHLDREFRTIALRLLRHLLRSAGEMGPILSAFTAKHCRDYTPEEEQLLFHVVYELASVRTDAIANLVGQRDDLPEVDAYLAIKDGYFSVFEKLGYHLAEQQEKHAMSVH